MTATVRSALDEFLADNGFTTAAYDAPTVDIPLGPFTVTLPSTEGRRRIVRWHDLHHVATGYGTDLRGEAEVGAWELRAGCTNLAGYVYNGLAVLVGLFLAPIRTGRAFVAARGASTLYRLDMRYEDALELPVEELRRRMGVPEGGASRRAPRLQTTPPGPKAA